MASGESAWPRWCTLCNVKLMNEEAESSHYLGQKHRKNIEARKSEAGKESQKSQAEGKPDISQVSHGSGWPRRCSLCDVLLSSQAVAASHHAGKKHRAKADSVTGVTVPKKSSKSEEGALDCTDDSLEEVLALIQNKKLRLKYVIKNEAGMQIFNDAKSRKENAMPAFEPPPFVSPGRMAKDAPSEIKPLSDQSKLAHSLSSSLTALDKCERGVGSENKDQPSNKRKQPKANRRNAQKGQSSNTRDEMAKSEAECEQETEKDEMGNTSLEDTNAARERNKSTKSKGKKGKKQQTKRLEKVTTKEPKVKEQLSWTVDENAAFQFVVKTYFGQCEIRQLKTDAQHIFPVGTDVLTLLLKSKSFKVFQRRDSSKLDESVVFVKLDKLKLCLRQPHCSFPYCPYIHLCGNLLAGYCSKVNCQFSHTLADEHNSRVLKELHLSDVFTEEEILSLLRCCTLFVCSRWNALGHCNLSKTYSLCPYLHVCQKFILGICENDKCKLGHSFDTLASKLLLGPAFYNLDKLPKASLRKAILVPKREEGSDTGRATVEGQQTQHIAEQEEKQDENLCRQPEVITDNAVVQRERSITQREQKHDSDFDHTTEMIDRRIKEPALGRRVREIDQPGREAEKLSDVHLFDDDTDRYICEANLRKQCRFGPGKCTKHHYPLPYVWQIMVSGVWKTNTENSSLEAAFCDVRRDNFVYYLEHGAGRMTMTIDFSTLKCEDKNAMASFPLRRLSTESYIEAPERCEYHTTWIWYWQDEAGQWIPYEVDASPYQDVIEAKFLAKQVACCAEINCQPYLLDFRNMTQINRATGKQRRIKRRPQLITAEEILLGNRKVKKWVRHFDKTVLPFGWAPMNTLSYTTPDLVLLDEQSAEFAMVYNKFFATLDLTQFSINYIFRIQNIALWEKYLRKKREMQQSAQLKGDINEKHLFHGTSSEDVVRCICKEGFDWRVCGKNGTLYGNGSYFARDASYSNNYSLKHSSGKQQMFLSLVLVGAYTKGERDLARPPQSYNSCVDTEKDPSIYVVFHDDQSYPQYLIEYKSK